MNQAAPDQPTLKIVLISGSLRRQSVNTAVLKTVAAMSWPGVLMHLYGGIAVLPHFNPDDDVDPLPEPVESLRRELAGCDGVFFSTPEYAASLPGSLKNLLDWSIGGASLYGAPVGWINPSNRGGAAGAYQALRNVLVMAGAEIVEQACITTPIAADAIEADGMIRQPQIQEILGQAVQSLLRQISAKPRQSRGVKG